MIYCVVPKGLADELYDKLVDYYKDDPNVEVIVDRRDGPDRRDKGSDEDHKEQRVTRDRRRNPQTGQAPPDVAPGT